MSYGKLVVLVRASAGENTCTLRDEGLLEGASAFSSLPEFLAPRSCNQEWLRENHNLEICDIDKWNQVLMLVPRLLTVARIL